MVEANDAAHDPCGRASAAVPDDFVMLADLLTGKIEKVRRRAAWFAHQAVTSTMGYEP